VQGLEKQEIAKAEAGGRGEWGFVKADVEGRA
jgi:hypothetical protein